MDRAALGIDLGRHFSHVLVGGDRQPVLRVWGRYKPAAKRETFVPGDFCAWLRSYIDEMKIVAIAYEKPANYRWRNVGFTQAPQAVLIDAVCSEKNVQVIAITPQQLRTAFMLPCNASKQQLAKAAGKMLATGLSDNMKDHDTDAAAMAVVAWSRWRGSA